MKDELAEIWMTLVDVCNCPTVYKDCKKSLKKAIKEIEPIIRSLPKNREVTKDQEILAS